MNGYNKYYSYSKTSPNVAPRRALPPQRPTRQQPKRSRLPALILAGLLIVGTVLLSAHHSHAHEKPVDKYTSLSSAQLAGLGTTVNNLLANYSGDTIAVYATDINTGQAVHYGSADTFTAASTTKLLSATYFLHQVENGHESLSESLSGSGASSLLKNMIVNSDDAAWQAINDELTHSGLQQYAERLGIKDYDPTNNTLAAADMQNLIVQLYQGKLLDAQNTRLLLSYMQQANYRDYIVAAVPQGLSVYHKAGVVDDAIHDTALIKYGSHVLALTIFSTGNGSYDGDARTQLIRSISRSMITTFLINNPARATNTTSS